MSTCVCQGYSREVQRLACDLKNLMEETRPDLGTILLAGDHVARVLEQLDHSKVTDLVRVVGLIRRRC